MIATHCQRWRDGRDSYRWHGEAFEPREHEVSAIADDRSARAFVEQHHYSKSFPAARRRFGLYAGGSLAGVAVFSVPVRPEALSVLRCPVAEGLELGRFVLLDAVKANAETWFLARCFDLLRREGFAGVVSFSDPFPRTRADGSTIFAGHVGTIYQASNAVFVGRAKPGFLRLLPDGSVLPARTLAKIRRRDRGWKYAVGKLVEHGAPEPTGDLSLWLARELENVTRRVKHPGNYKYAFALCRAVRRALPASQPYPKLPRDA